MKKKLLSRLGQSLIALLGVALLLFLMLRVVPGNPAAVMMGEHGDNAAIARMTAELGLDQPILTQFFRYIGDCFTGNFGTSYSLSKPVAELMGGAFLNTLWLALAAALFAWMRSVMRL
jgi:peptide/nickel transport system permease protein